MKATLYVEGGGDGRSRARFHEGWRKFLRKADMDDKVKIVSGGGRAETYKLFVRAVASAGSGEAVLCSWTAKTRWRRDIRSGSILLPVTAGHAPVTPATIRRS